MPIRDSTKPCACAVASGLSCMAPTSPCRIGRFRRLRAFPTVTATVSPGKIKSKIRHERSLCTALDSQSPDLLLGIQNCGCLTPVQPSSNCRAQAIEEGIDVFHGLVGTSTQTPRRVANEPCFFVGRIGLCKFQRTTWDRMRLLVAFGWNLAGLRSSVNSPMMAKPLNKKS